MKRKILAIASVIALTAPIQSVAFAHESDSPIALRWSAESVHNEGVSSHLWIVNRAIDIMSQNTTVVKQNETALLNDWRTNLEEGIYSADYKNPYYDY